MVDIFEAIKLMRQVKKIIRKTCESSGRYLYLRCGTGDWCDYICLSESDDPNTNGDIHSMSCKEIEADDWVEYFA